VPLVSCLSDPCAVSCGVSVQVCMSVSVCFVSVKGAKVLYKMCGFEIKAAFHSATQVFTE